MLLSSDVLAALIAVALIWLVGLSAWLYNMTRHYQRLVGKTGRENLKFILEKILADTEATEVHIKKVEGSLDSLGKRSLRFVQKIGVVRFNPFSNTGGNQSFALALLDGQDSGIVVLSLHGREGTRIYVKPIKGGKSLYELSKEEKQAIEEAKEKR